MKLFVYLKREILEIALFVSAIVSLFSLTELIIASRLISSSQPVLALLSKKLKVQTYDIANEMKWEALQRIDTYEQLIKKNYLIDGMLVNRSIDGTPIDHCDSLLFSSLRFIALKKLGRIDDANAAWTAIAKSRDKGKWFRHPQCKNATSRDMILGVVAALTQKPSDTKAIITDLLLEIGQNGGFFANGPFYVSFISPGLAFLLYQISQVNAISMHNFPSLVEYSFSTVEWDSLTSVRGYRSHLIALATWVELELSKSSPVQRSDLNSRAVIASLAPILSPFTNEPIISQRLQWVAYNLSILDRDNLFFVWLRLKASGLLNDATRLKLLERLLAMPQFPRDGLPSNCTRQADYLWQRNSKEYYRGNENCTKTFNGVDFIWMASLLLDDSSLEGGLAQESYDNNIVQ